MSLSFGSTLLSFIVLIACTFAFNFTSIFEPGASGNASTTHYSIPDNFVAACGCAIKSATYPTAAINTAAYQSTSGSGPACGYCFNVSLIEAIEATPPFVLNASVRPWVVVKITDQCPAPTLTDPDKTWCGATSTKANMAGSFVHFDLSSPSLGIPATFFPSNPILYGYSDFGAWRAFYEVVSCESWKGAADLRAVGRDPSVAADAGCCPADPLIATNASCPAAAANLGNRWRAMNINESQFLLLWLILCFAISLCSQGF